MTINELLAAAGLNGTDELPIWNGATQKVTAQQLANAVKTLANLQGQLTFDSAPTAGSTNPVTSEGINTAIQQSTAFHVGDTYNFASAQMPFRTLADKSAIYFCIHMPKAIGNDVTGFNVSFSGTGNTWFSNGSAGTIPTDATIGNKSINGSSVVRFTTTTSATPLANSGFGIAELYGTITFT